VQVEEHLQQEQLAHHLEVQVEEHLQVVLGAPALQQLQEEHLAQVWAEDYSEVRQV
jgi:hypothetical protein